MPTGELLGRPFLLCIRKWHIGLHGAVREMSVPTRKKARISGGQPAASEPEVFLLYEGGEVAEELGRSLTRVRIGPQATEIPNGAFRGCDKLIELQLNEGLEAIGKGAFIGCTALRSVTLPSSVTELTRWAFSRCSSLVKLNLKEGLQVIGAGAFEGCTLLQNVTFPSTVTELGQWAFMDCSGIVELKLKEGLQIIGGRAFSGCSSLQKVSLPSTVTKLSSWAFMDCSDLVELELKEGLQVIGECAFEGCRALRSVTIPSTVNKLGSYSFAGCSNLSDVILLGGKSLFNQEFIDCGFRREQQGLLNQEELDEMLFGEYDGGEREFAFHGCPLTTVKISIGWAVSERIARLPREGRLSVEERIHTLNPLKLQQDGNILVCFPVVRGAPDDEAHNATFEVRDTNHETARSLYQVLQIIAFHELKESSILLELAMWKSKIDGVTSVPRADCRVAVPDPAKTLIMEYCGFAGFLEPAIEGA